MMCLCCYEDITDVIIYNNNQVLDYCYDCLSLLLKEQWNKYIQLLKNNTCKNSLIRVIEAGPPRYFQDPRINNNHPIKNFTFKNTIISGQTTPLTKNQLIKLDGILKTYLTCVDDLNIENILNIINESN